MAVAYWRVTRVADMVRHRPGPGVRYAWMERDSALPSGGRRYMRVCVALFHGTVWNMSWIDINQCGGAKDSKVRLQPAC